MVVERPAAGDIPTQVAETGRAPATSLRSLDETNAWSLRHRVAWLRRFRQAIAANADELCRHADTEVHKQPGEAITADIAALLAACKWHERHARGILKPRRARGTPLWMFATRVQLTRAPLGRVGIIATWNYPIQLLGIQLVQALVAGNRVVVKPSERAPLTQNLLLDLAIGAGLPLGTLDRCDATADAGRELVERGAIDHLVFTGSTRVGRQIALAAAARLLPTTLELSGCDSAIVLADADAEQAARSIWFGVTVNGGQTCMAPRRAFVDRRVYAQFLAALAPLVSGSPVRTLIDPNAARACVDLAREAVAMGGRSLSGVLESPLGTNPSAIRPLAIVDCPRDAALVAGDHFGPVLAVVPVDGPEDALRVHHGEFSAHPPQHLSASVFTRDINFARAWAPRLGASVVTINDCVIPQAHPALSIAGCGPSGWGASRGVDGLLAMTRPVAVCRTSNLGRAPTDPMTTAQASRLARLIARLYR